MKRNIAILLLTFLLSILFNVIGIKRLKKLNAGQTVLKYVEEHKSKNGTPTMGGLFFTFASIIIFMAFNGFSFNYAFVSSVIVFAYMCVGFLDDFIKIKFKQNEGLKPYQKIIFQFSIAVISAIYSYRNGLTDFYLPFSAKQINLGWFSIPLIIFVFIAVTNCVNLTDGLDGLAGSVSVVYLFFLSTICILQSGVDNYGGLPSLNYAFIGGVLAFLMFNCNKASIFMGDTGSLALGGLIASTSIFSKNCLIVPILGITFVLSGISVLLQVVYFKLSGGKRIFLIAPLHHHYQHKGYSESKITFVYSLITGLFGGILILAYI